MTDMQTQNFENTLLGKTIISVLIRETQERFPAPEIIVVYQCKDSYSSSNIYKIYSTQDMVLNLYPSNPHTISTFIYEETEAEIT